MPTCDLHIHSDCSDGTFTPEELIEIAKASDVKAVALCDHNTVLGVSRFINTAKGSNIAAIAGVEVTTEYNGNEVHVLGLFLREEFFTALTEYLKQINEIKIKSNIRLAEKLKAGGYDIDYAAIAEKAGSAIPNRVHFARALMEKGYISSVSEGFETLLSPDGKFYEEAQKLSTLDVIGFLAAVKAVPVIAHPLESLSHKTLRELLPKAKECGLVGMEVFYTLYDEEKTAKAISLAKENGLLFSGGSDFHGENKPDIKIGSGKGNLSVPYYVYEKLKAVADRL